MNCTQAMEEYAESFTRLDVSHESARCAGDITDMVNTWLVVCFEHRDRIQITRMEVHA